MLTMVGVVSDHRSVGSVGSVGGGDGGGGQDCVRPVLAGHIVDTDGDQQHEDGAQQEKQDYEENLSRAKDEEVLSIVEHRQRGVTTQRVRQASQA